MKVMSTEEAIAGEAKLESNNINAAVLDNISATSQTKAAIPSYDIDTPNQAPLTEAESPLIEPRNKSPNK